MWKSAIYSIPGPALCQPCKKYRVRLHMKPARHFSMETNRSRLLKESVGPGKYFQKDSAKKESERTSSEDKETKKDNNGNTPTTEERLQKLNNHEHRIILDKSRAVSKHHHPRNSSIRDVDGVGYINEEDAAVIQVESNNQLSIKEKNTIEGNQGQEGKSDVKTETNEEDEEAQQSDFLRDTFDEMEPYIDTHVCYTELRNAGFTKQQAETIIKLLLCLLNDKLLKLSTKYSQTYELDNEQYLYESAQQELRVDVTRSREQHINEMISLINILERDFSIINDELATEMINMKNIIEVAINDQKQENTLLSKLIILKIQEANHKITTELISSMRSEIESLRWNLSRWGLMAIIMSLFSGCSLMYFNRITRTKQQDSNEFNPLVIYEPSELEEDDYHVDLDKSVIA